MPDQQSPPPQKLKADLSLDKKEGAIENLSRRVLVAKKVPPDYLGQELQYTQPENKPIPISVKGPKKRRDGKLVEYTLLGDIQDFEEMEEEIEGNSHVSIDTDKKETGPENQREDQMLEEERKIEQQRVERLAAAKKKQLNDRKRWLNRLYIFQRYRELREERALRNWKRHIYQRKKKKSRTELLMSRLGEHRERMEDRELIYEAFQLLEDQKVNFWSKGLRIGSELLGLIVTIPKGGPRRMERLVANETKHYKVNDDPNSYHELRKQEVKNVITKIDPFAKTGTGSYMEIVGKALDSKQLENLAEAYAEKLDKRAKKISLAVPEYADKKIDHQVATNPSLAQEKTSENELTPTEKAAMRQNAGFASNSLALSKLPPLSTDNVDLVFAATHMSFEVLLNEVSRSVLSIYNQSPISYHFEWKRVVKDNPLNVKAINDGVQRFYFYHKKGVILPGTAFDFPVIFKSGAPGIFSEIWQLVTNPRVPENVTTQITFQGFALEEDLNISKRKGIEDKLNHKIATTIAKEVISDIFARMKPMNSTPSTLQRKKLLLANDERLFTALNAKLYFETLAAEILAILNKPVNMWDRSVKAIYSNIGLIEDVEKKSVQYRKINELVKLCTVNTSKSSFPLLYVIGYDTFVDLADRISETSESLRKNIGLPLMRAAAQFERVEEE
ncbi:hypothetical protein HK100_005279, partial [Physocladia obscura]